MRYLLCAWASMALTVVAAGQPVESQVKPLRVLASVTPMYVLTSNIVADVPGVTLEMMVPPDVGCPHHYAVTPEDVRQMANADVVIVQGRGLDDFVQHRLEKLGAGAEVIVAGAKLSEVVHDHESHHDEEHDHADHDHAKQDAAEHDHAGHGHAGHDHAGHDHGDAADQHAWTRVENAIAMVRHITQELCRHDPARAEQYERNAEQYVARLTKLQEEGEQVAKKLAGRAVLPMHSSLIPMLESWRLEVIGTIEEHSGTAPTPARLRQVIDLVRKHKGDRQVLLVAEPQYPDKAVRLISAETKATMITLDPLAGWANDHPPKDAYERTYRTNLAAVTKAMGD